MRRLLLIFLIPLALLAGCPGDSTQGPPPIAPAIVTGTGVRMVEVPAGSFEMGSDDGRPDERPAHRVWIDALLEDQFEVTQKDFAKYLPRYESKFKGADNPVEQLNWQDAVRYCNKRSEAEGLEVCYTLDMAAGKWQCDFTKNGYRLPTEAEWEYACRAGADAKAGPADLGRHAWYAENAGGTTHPVGKKLPNAWGLYDMLGNVGEWCNDPYMADAYATAAERNPHGPADGGGLFVLRGGAYRMPAAELRSTARRGEIGYVDNCENREHLGFRPVRAAPPAETQPAGQEE